MSDTFSIALFSPLLRTSMRMRCITEKKSQAIKQGMQNKSTSVSLTW